MYFPVIPDDSHDLIEIMILVVLLFIYEIIFSRHLSRFIFHGC